MSLKIRLARAGTKKRPFYHIVIADSRSPRDGRRIGGERAQLHLAADAMRGTDLGHTDAGGHCPLANLLPSP